MRMVSFAKLSGFPLRIPGKVSRFSKDFFPGTRKSIPENRESRNFPIPGNESREISRRRNTNWQWV